MYVRNCPKCNKSIQYKIETTYIKANDKKTCCKKCSTTGIKKIKEKNYSRNCPKCNNIIFYKKIKFRDDAEKLNSICRSCQCGVRNSLQKGKPISEKAKLSFKNKDYSFMHSDSYRSNMSKSTKGAKNGMSGRSVYSVWLEKFGKEIADQKMIDFKKKQSKNSSGKNNPMFGKPSPTGSGNGWCGWYKGWHFRSLLELSYMINVIERFNLKWENAEQKKYSVAYKINNTDHTYYPDFVINDKYIVDCKPKHLQDSELNTIKKTEALKHFKNIGLKFKFVRCRKLSNDELLKLYKEQKIKFIERYELKFREKFKQ